MDPSGSRDSRKLDNLDMKTQRMWKRGKPNTENLCNASSLVIMVKFNDGLQEHFQNKNIKANYKVISLLKAFFHNLLLHVFQWTHYIVLFQKYTSSWECRALRQGLYKHRRWGGLRPVWHSCEELWVLLRDMYLKLWSIYLDMTSKILNNVPNFHWKKSKYKNLKMQV